MCHLAREVFLVPVISFIYCLIFSYHLISDIDECGSKPCMNGGTCNDKLNGYECQCLPAYTGEKCQGKFT